MRKTDESFLGKTKDLFSGADHWGINDLTPAMRQFYDSLNPSEKEQLQMMTSSNMGSKRMDLATALKQLAAFRQKLQPMQRATVGGAIPQQQYTGDLRTPNPNRPTPAKDLTHNVWQRESFMGFLQSRDPKLFTYLTEGKK